MHGVLKQPLKPFMKYILVTFFIYNILSSQQIDSILIDSRSEFFAMYSVGDISKKRIDQIKISSFEKLETFSVDLLKTLNDTSLNLKDDLDLTNLKKDIAKELLILNTENEVEVDTAFAYKITNSEIIEHLKSITITSHHSSEISIKLYYNDGLQINISSSIPRYFGFPWIYTLNGNQYKSYNIKLAKLIQTFFPSDFVNYDKLTLNNLASEIAENIFIRKGF